MIKKERLELARAARKGFTLIEILIVVAIIAILASVVLVGLGPTQQAGRDSRRLSDLHEVQNGLELYYNGCGYYPGAANVTTPCAGFSATTGYSTGATPLNAALPGSTFTGVSSIPNDPTSGHTYLYATDAVGSTYIIAATLENKANSVFGSYTPPNNTGSMSTGDSASIGGCATAGEYCLSI